VHAAIGLVQVGRLDSIIVERRRLAQRYDTLLAGEPSLSAPHEPPGYYHTYQSYCVRLADGCSRPAIMAELLRKGIATRRGVMAIHLEPAYRRRFPDISLPITEAASAETLLLPLFVGMTDAEQDFVVESLRAAVG
jgi:perosamine synthetase